MPPYVALALWLACLVLLFKFDPAKEQKTSVALWVPVIALFIIGSRSPTQWLGGVAVSADSIQEGSPIDRAISLVLILLAFGILKSRSFKWGEFFARNLAFSVMILFGLLSVIWSDFPFVAFKRWFRDIGDYLVLFVVLSDSHPYDAIRVVLRRTGYLLIPLSIMLDKYFPELGRAYDTWSGVGYYQGATTSKNMLGLTCMVSGLFFLWDSASRWAERRNRKTKRILLVNGIFVAMSVSLLINASSTTSTVCFLLGSAVIIGANTAFFRRRPGLLKGLVPTMFLFYLALTFAFDMGGTLAQSVGKDPTLTDRTRIWAFLLNMHTNPVIGAGYKSFWLGDRLDFFWNDAGLGHINSAHNGYLAIYLEQGLIGVGILIIFLISSYRLICRRLTQNSNIAVMGLAAWICLVFYNMSEASFGGGLLYLTFILVGVSVPALRKQQVGSIATVTNGGPEEAMSSTV